MQEVYLKTKVKIMLKQNRNISKLLLVLCLIVPLFLAASSDVIKKPTLSYRDVRRYQSEEKKPRLEINIVSEGFEPNSQVKMKQGGSCKTPFGVKSALLMSDSNFSQIAYDQ
jgi:hypothetical protein